MSEGSSQLPDGSAACTCRIDHEGAVLLQPLPFSQASGLPKDKGRLPPSEAADMGPGSLKG